MERDRNGETAISEFAHIADLLNRGRTDLVLARSLGLLRQNPNDLDALRLAALAYTRQNNLIKAEHYLLRATKLAPNDPGLVTALGALRVRQESYDAAIGLFRRALQLDPNNSDALSNLAAMLTLLRRPIEAKPLLETLIRVLPYSSDAHRRASGNAFTVNDIGRAIRYGRKAVRLAPEEAPGRLALAEALEAAGRFKQAKFEYLAVLTNEAGNVAALAQLLSMKGVHVDACYIRTASKILEEPGIPDAERAQLSLGLAHYHDTQGEYEVAFEHLRAANALRFKRHAFDSRAQSDAVDRIIRACTAASLAAVPLPSARGKKPIIIVGMPRSGTTLVEQILSSHSQVAAGGELPTIINIAQQIVGAGTRYPEAAREVNRSIVDEFARQYLDKLDAIGGAASHVTDKMPFNFMHLWLIAVLLPDAIILHCRRAALDTCLSCHFTGFNEELQFASDLGTLARYWIDYQRLMEHWRTVLPGRVHDVDYERLVFDTEGSVKELLAFCNLPWEDGCMQFYKTHSGVRTPSRWQVRQPVYRHSVGRWRKYERQLEPLRTVLRNGAQKYSIQPSLLQ